MPIGLINRSGRIEEIELALIDTSVTMLVCSFSLRVHEIRHEDIPLIQHIPPRVNETTGVVMKSSTKVSHVVGIVTTCLYGFELSQPKIKTSERPVISLRALYLRDRVYSCAARKSQINPTA